MPWLKGRGQRGQMEAINSILGIVEQTFFGAIWLVFGCFQGTADLSFLWSVLHGSDSDCFLGGTGKGGRFRDLLLGSLPRLRGLQKTEDSWPMARFIFNSSCIYLKSFQKRIGQGLW